MTPSDAPWRLQSGQTLQRPLIHPATGQTFLPAGSTLTEHQVKRIRKLGLERETLDCISPPPFPVSPVSPLPSERPKPLAEPSPARTQDGELEKGLQRFLGPAGSDEPALVQVMELIRTMIARLRLLELGNFPAVRIFGGGDTAHPLNVTMLSLLIGIAMGRTEEQLFRLGQAAMLHDIGKYSLDPKLVNKTEPLTSAERRVLERHVEFGIDTLLGHRASALGLSPDVLATIHAHHERWDGSGYPRGLKRRKIPLDARILAVADAYETMTTDRPYRTRRVAGDAYREILGLSGEAFDPQVIDAFRRVIVPYPNQTQVLLSSGQVGQVIRQGRSPDHPIVHLGNDVGMRDLGAPGSPRIVKQILPRRFPRMEVELPARIALTDLDGAHPGRLHDVSLGGANVASPRPLPVGTQVLLSLDTPDQQEVWLPGVVASCAHSAGPTRLGIRFMPLSPEAKQALESLVGAAERR